MSRTRPRARRTRCRRRWTPSRSTRRCASWATASRSSPRRPRRSPAGAIDLIEVEYEELPAIIDPRDALKPGAPVIHDEADYVDFDQSDRTRNLAAHIFVDIGNVDQGFAEADHIFEAEYLVPKVQHVSIEPHVVITYWDEDDRLVVRTSTQVPFHARRILAPVLGLPVKRIRVIKPRIGGGFGGKQEVLIEDAAGHLTIATGRPVRLEYSREEEFVASRSRHPMIVRVKTGVKADGTITANEMSLISDTGAYGSHALTVAGNTGHKAMALYVGDGPYRESPNIRFLAQTVYTNTVPSGAFRGYGVPQGFFPVELADGADLAGAGPRPDRVPPEERAPRRRGAAVLEGLVGGPRAACPSTSKRARWKTAARRAAELIGWSEKRGNAGWHHVPGKPHLRRGVGVRAGDAGHGHPVHRHGRRVAQDERRRLVQPADRRDGHRHRVRHGPGPDGRRDGGLRGRRHHRLLVGHRLHAVRRRRVRLVDDLHLGRRGHPGGAAGCADDPRGGARALQPGRRRLAGQSRRHPAGRPPGHRADGRRVTLEEIALRSLHSSNQRQIMAVASFNSPVSPPPFTAQFAEVTVDTQTGEVRVSKLVTVQDSGVIVNPVTATGQVEGAVTQQLGYALTEEMPFDAAGRPLMRTCTTTTSSPPTEMPELVTEFVETVEPTHPFGVKAVGEVPMDGVAPAIANAIYDAVRQRTLNQIPATPERVGAR